MGEGEGEKRKEGFSPSALSLFRFHLSPFPPETPDTQAKEEKELLLCIVVKNEECYDCQ